MARGRMISATIGESRKFAQLANHTHRLIYLMVLPHVDKAGRFEADPVVIKSKCLMRLDIDLTTVEAWLKDGVTTGLLRVYVARGIRVLEIADFLKHNTPHYKEPDSTLPPPEEGTPWETQETNVEATSSQRQVNVASTLPIREVKERKEKEREVLSESGDSDFARTLIETWNSESGKLTKCRVPSREFERLAKTLRKRHGTETGLELFRAGITAVRNDPHWLGSRSDPVKRSGTPYGIVNYLRHVEEKADAALELRSTPGRAGPVRFRLHDLVYRPSDKAQAEIVELIDPMTAVVDTGETWDLRGCERWTN